MTFPQIFQCFEVIVFYADVYSYSTAIPGFSDIKSHPFSYNTILMEKSLWITSAKVFSESTRHKWFALGCPILYYIAGYNSPRSIYRDWDFYKRNSFVHFIPFFNQPLQK